MTTESKIYPESELQVKVSVVDVADTLPVFSPELPKFPLQGNGLFAVMLQLLVKTLEEFQLTLTGAQVATKLVMQPEGLMSTLSKSFTFKSTEGVSCFTGVVSTLPKLGLTVLGTMAVVSSTLVLFSAMFIAKVATLTASIFNSIGTLGRCAAKRSWSARDKNISTIPLHYHISPLLASLIIRKCV